jgi:plastocyanin
MNLCNKVGLIAMFFFIGLSAQAAEHLVDQKEKNFSAPHLSIKVGDTVTFRNSDKFFHNVFSMSDAKTFDLGSYPQGKSKTVTFDKPGIAEVECAIHPNMKLTIEVSK